MRTYIASISILLLMIVFTEPSQAQDKSKSDVKKQQKMEMRKNKDAILKLVDQKSFVIKADMLQDRYLNNYNVNSTVNFVKIDSNKAVVQFAFDNVVGWNGVGGLTEEGRLSGYRVDGRKGLDPVSVIADISSSGSGFLTLYITIFNDGMARATVTGSFGSRITFSGNFVSLDGARIYQGTSRY